MTDQDAAQQPEPEAHKSALSHIMMQNIRTIVDLRQRAAGQRGLQESIADAVTAFSGRMLFVYVHIVWFSLWVALNTGRLGLPVFDPFPYGLLTMIVSLEAIFLSTFVLISHNRLSEEAERRSDLDLQMDLLTEHELTRALLMLDMIQEKLGIENNTDAELVELEQEIKPEDVLAEIERLQHLSRQQNKPAGPAGSN